MNNTTQASATLKSNTIAYSLEDARNSPDKLGLNFPVNKLSLRGDMQPIEAFDADMQPIEGAFSGGIQIDNFVAIEAKGQVYNCPSDGYEVLQPAQWFDTMLDIVENSGCPVEYVKARHVGGIINLDVKIESFEIKRPCDRKVGDLVAVGVQSVDSINSTRAFSLNDFEERLWCANGCSRMQKGDISFKARHSSNLMVNVSNAAREFAKQIESLHGVKQRFQSWADAEVSPSERIHLVDTILGFDPTEKITAAKQKQRDLIQSLTIRGNGNTGASLWDVFNGFTEYQTHFARTRGANSVQEISDARFIQAHGLRGSVKPLAVKAAETLDKALEVGPLSITL